MVFFALNNREYKSIEYNGGSFQGCINLRYFEMPETITHINNYAFSGCTMMFGLEYTEEEIKNFFRNIKTINNRAFVSCGGQGKTFYLPAGLQVINERSFFYGKLSNVVFGAPGEPSQYNPTLYDGENGLGIFDEAPYLTKITIYTDDVSNTKWETFKEQIGKINQVWTWEVLQA